jgi:hypothetical protein
MTHPFPKLVRNAGQKLELEIVIVNACWRSRQNIPVFKQLNLPKQLVFPGCNNGQVRNWRIAPSGKWNSSGSTAAAMPGQSIA